MCYHYTTAAKKTDVNVFTVYSVFSTIANNIIELHVLKPIFARSGYKWVQNHRHRIAINIPGRSIRATTGSMMEVKFDFH